MAFTNSTTHYGLPQWIGTDKPTYLVDQNNAYATIDAQLYTASTDASSAVATANSASTSATTAAENAATALSTANTADGKADSAITQSELAQTAAGAAQVAAAAAQEAAAGNSITNLAPAYDSTLTYAVGDLVTAEGKLYKCIVAVATPMDFDINYWDDVTTSEVYSKIGSGYTKTEADNKFVAKSVVDYDPTGNTLTLESANGDTELFPTFMIGQSKHFANVTMAIKQETTDGVARISVILQSSVFVAGTTYTITAPTYATLVSATGSNINILADITEMQFEQTQDGELRFIIKTDNATVAALASKTIGFLIIGATITRTA